MKANELQVDGFYWCTHDLGWYIPPGKEYPQEWDVVQFDSEYLQLYLAGADVSVEIANVPDYVSFFGPLQPPTEEEG